MAELDLIHDERPGILKEIDEGAMDLIFQAIQEDIYSFPIRSFVREGISNGLDAIVERKVFSAINAGKPVEDYYLQRNDGKLLKDSSFDKSYYNENFLSSNSKVMVTYNEGSPRDSITIKDEGVGLGGSRLKGYFKLGYSSKRNMKHAIGKFGAGAKAGLATGVEYFVMETVYNGFKTSFMIFKHDYDPITPHHDDGANEIWAVKMADGTVQDRTIYWEPTTDSNGVSVTLEVKKHNMELFIDSVKSQFQYFNGQVHLTHTELDGNVIIDKLSETPSYESNALLIPKYSTYSSPHILVDGISYGLVSWDELELEKRQGRIAIKVKATDVDITQSRESLKWTEKTKNTVLGAIELAKNEASDHMTKRLAFKDDQDIFHINRLYGNMHTREENSVDSVFKKFLDISHIRAKFILRGKFGAVEARMSFQLFEFLFYKYTVKKVTTYHEDGKLKIRSETIESFSSLGDNRIIYADKSTLGPKLAVHILEKYEVGSFIYIRENAARSKTVLEYGKQEYSTSMVTEYTRGLLTEYCDLDLDTYEVVYTDDTEELDGVVAETKKETGLAAKARKLNKELLYMEYKSRSLDLHNHHGRLWEMTYGRRKEVVKVANMKEEFEDPFGNLEPLIIVPGKFTPLGKLVEISCYMTTGEWPTNVIYISQEVVKHFLPYGILVTDYFRQLNTQTGELMIGKHIRELNTLRMFNELISKYSTFSTNGNIIDTLTNIDIINYRAYRHNSGDWDPKTVLTDGGKLGDEMVDEVFGYLEVLEKFHKIVKTGNKEEIATQALELFGSGEIYYLDAYDDEFIDTMEAELKRLSPIEPLLDTVIDMDLTRTEGLLNLLLETKNKLRDDNVS
jgi:hypothetical protein